MKTKDILATLKGEGSVREATPEFWEIRRTMPKTLSRLRFELYKDGSRWMVDVSKVETDADVEKTLNQVRADNAFYKSGCWRDVDGH